jgi:hypothetical protein
MFEDYERVAVSLVGFGTRLTLGLVGA